MPHEVKRVHNSLSCRNKTIQTPIIVSRRNGNQRKNMKIIIPTIYYALGAALLASIHGISAYDLSEEINDFQFDVDQEVDVVSCYLCGHDDTFGIPLLSTPHAHLLSFPL
jgi:hypothetical protein